MEITLLNVFLSFVILLIVRILVGIFNQRQEKEKTSISETVRPQSSLIRRLTSTFKSFVYDTLFARPVSRDFYRSFHKIAKEQLKVTHSMLDVGIGTGLSFETIVQDIPLHIRVTGLDIDPSYVEVARKRLQKFPNVDVRLQNFYELSENDAAEKYDLILFCSSIMLMPDKKKAIEIAKSLLNKGGKIYFLLALYTRRNWIYERIKPFFVYATSIDFGTVTYEDEFHDLLEKCGLVTLNKTRILVSSNPLHRLHRAYTFECAPKDLAK